MKIKINPYIYTLIKENAVYIAADILFLLLTIIIVSLSISKNIQDADKISGLNADIKNLQDKSNTLNSVLAGTQNLDEDIKLLKTLIPDSEDYFSIIYALDKISQQTGFIITSYTVNLRQSNNDQLQIAITGTGDNNAFINFLKNYNFSGGRLITSDKIELSPQMSGTIKINVAFYHKKDNATTNQVVNFSNKSFVELSSIMDKVQFALKSGTQSATVETNYPRKSNPF